MNENIKWCIGVMAVSIFGVGWSLLAPPKLEGGNKFLLVISIIMFLVTALVMWLGSTKGWANEKPKRKKSVKTSGSGQGPRGILRGGLSGNTPRPPSNYSAAQSKSGVPPVVLGSEDDFVFLDKDE